MTLRFTGFKFNWHGSWRQMAGAGIALLSLGLLGWAAWTFWQLEPLEIPGSRLWNIFAVGLLAWIAGIFLLTWGEAKSSESDESHSYSAIPLAIIVGISIFLRLYNFDVHPYGVWHDEAGAGLQAQQMLADSDYRPIFIGSMNITFPHMYLYAMMLDRFGDTNIQAMRLISVGFGVGSVILGYLLGRQLRGHGFGLLMAGFLGAMRWSIHFSHIAMTGIDNVFFILLTLYFLVRLIQNRQMRDALWAGLAIGGGLWFYSAFRLALLAMGIGLLINWPVWRPFTKTLRLWAIVGLTALLTIFPLAIFAYENTDYFLIRLRVVSINNEAGRLPGESVNEAVLKNTEAYLKMFHVHGDTRGLHNISGEPMLDPVMGVLMVIGLVVSVWRRDGWFFILVMAAGLISGILTNQYEAPSAGRSIGVIPAVAFFCAAGVWQLARWLRQVRVPQRVIVGASAAVLIVVAALNGVKYYRVQAHDFYSWADFATREKIISEILAERHERGYDLIISNRAYARDTTNFLIPEVYPYIREVDSSGLFPIRTNTIRPVSIILAGTENWLLDYAKQLYPNAQFESVPLDAPGLLNVYPGIFVCYVIDLQPADVAALQGLSEDGQGYLLAEETGRYRFLLEDGQVLKIDGQPLDTDLPEVEMVAGLHYVETDHSILWQPPFQGNFEPIPRWMLFKIEAFQGLWGYFYPNENWEGEPALQRLDVTINQYFHLLPLDRPYTALWNGYIDIPASGEYGFRIKAIGYAELYLKNAFVVKTEEVNQFIEARVTLEAGMQPIQVRFRDTLPYSDLRVEWQIPGGAWEPVPSNALLPQPSQN